MSNNNNSELVKIPELTEEGKKKLETITNELKNHSENLRSKSAYDHLSKEETVTSSFNEAFPDYKENAFKRFSTLFENLDSETLKQLLKERGLSVFKLFETEAKKITKEDLDKLKGELEKVKEELNKANEDLSDLKGFTSNMSEKLQKQEEVLNNINTFSDRALNAAERALTLFENNQLTFNLIAGSAAIVSPLLAYRGLLMSYSKFYNLTSGPLTDGQLKTILDARNRQIKRFNSIAIPFLFAYFLAYERKSFTLNINHNISTGNINTSNSSLLFFFKNKFNDGKFGSIILLIAGIIKYNLPVIQETLKSYLNPYLYDKLAMFINLYLYNICMYAILGTIIFILFLYLLEFYIFIHMNLGIFEKPKYMSKFLENIINQIEKEHSLNMPKIFINMYLKNIILYFIILILFILFAL